MKWNTIRRGSKITLKEDRNLKSFNGEVRLIKAGTYFITGFWADIVGLNTFSAKGKNEVCIQSRELIAFNGITA